MAVEIAIPTALRSFTDGKAAVTVDAATVGGALDALTRAHPQLSKHLLDSSGKLRSFVNVYLGDEDIRYVDGGLDAALSAGDSLIIVPSIAGGSTGGGSTGGGSTGGGSTGGGSTGGGSTGGGSTGGGSTGNELNPEGAMSETPVWAKRVDELPELNDFDYARYSRHLILEDVGVEGQRRLKGASVLCVGTGGLGSPLLLYLAAAGVGRIGIVDFDIVDESNLQRQVIHGSAMVGRPKIESARSRILDINPHCQVDLYPVALQASNALEIIEPYDIVVDGTDNFPTRYLVNDACVILGKPNVYGSIFKFEGQASVFNFGDGPQYRDLYPEPPPPGLVPSCAEGGVLGILPGVIGCIQATETLKILLGKGTSLAGRLLLYDALGMKFRELKLRRDPNGKPITKLIDYQEFCGVPSLAEGASPTDVIDQDEGFVRISVTQAKARIDDGWRPFVLDVRKPHELEISRLSFMDLQRNHEDVVAGQHSNLPRDRPVLVTCKVGGRSAKAAEALVAAGFTDVTNLEGGINEWARQIDPSLHIY